MTSISNARVPLRVAYLIHGTGLGGGELLLVEHLAHRDPGRLAPLVICRGDGPLAQRLRELDIPVALVAFDHGRELFGHISVPRLRPLHQIVQLLRRHGIDLLHSYTLETRNLAHAAAVLAGVPLIHTSQDTWFGDLFGRSQWLILNRIPARLIATSAAVHRSLRVGTRLRSDLVTTISPGIDLERFRPRADAAAVRAELGIAADEHVVGIVGRLCSVKDFTTFFAAVAAVAAGDPALRVLVVGGAVLPDDDYADGIERDIDRLGLRRRVIRTGFRDDVPRLMAAMDLLVSSSPRESFGLVLAEAAACGKPVVATRSGGAEEIVVPEVTGLLVPPRDPPALAAAIARLLADPALARRYGAAARRHAEARFDIREMVVAIQRQYDIVAARRH